MYIENGALFGRSDLKSLVDQPGTFIIQDVRPNLSNKLWITITIQKVVLRSTTIHPATGNNNKGEMTTSYVVGLDWRKGYLNLEVFS